MRACVRVWVRACAYIYIYICERETLIFDATSPLALWDVAERHVAMFRLTTRRVSELALAYMNVRAGAWIRTQDASTPSL